MGDYTQNRPCVALFLKRSSWQVFVEERRDPHIVQLLAQGDPTVARMRASHDDHERTVAEVLAALGELGVDHELIAHEHRGLDLSRFALVITVGGDGTLLNASHSVDGVPVLGINSSPTHSVGFFCGAVGGQAKEAVAAALAGTLERTVLTRMQVSVNGEVVATRVLNEALFCHPSPAATTRYIIELTRKSTGRTTTEEQKSSGLWIGPAAGSTAAQRSAGGRVLPLESHDLQLVVREVYLPQGERYRLRRLLIGPEDRLIVRSKIPDARIFFDGQEHLAAVKRGDAIQFSQSRRPLTILGIASRAREEASTSPRSKS